MASTDFFLGDEQNILFVLKNTKIYYSEKVKKNTLLAG